MVIRSGSLDNALVRFTRVEDGINNETEIMSRLSANIMWMRVRLPDQTLQKTVKEMKAAGIRITENWLSGLEKSQPIDLSFSRLIMICNFYQVTLHEALFEYLSEKYRSMV